MGFFLFENYSATKEKSRKYPSLIIKKPINRVFEDLTKFVKDQGFDSIKTNEEFYDIYGERYGYEISIQLAVDGFNTLLNMSIYGEKKRGRTRKAFKRYYSLIKQLFEL